LKAVFYIRLPPGQIFKQILKQMIAVKMFLLQKKLLTKLRREKRLTVKNVV